ncbi:hypothetical protein GMES_4244 [Paraglaciecola mesophila KMM 241]|uniref:Uncharacterized protein n=1 Tax=Paraglaciecola mesophila KMM 241 TaxID=1128912 RepID=K6ZT73_9ALTE|nr:hypothetical protein GMES_4244 [Paraglaciecola mesophila KMM 241]
MCWSVNVECYSVNASQKKRIEYSSIRFFVSATFGSDRQRLQTQLPKGNGCSTN